MMSTDPQQGFDHAVGEASVLWTGEHQVGAPRLVEVAPLLWTRPKPPAVVGAVGAQVALGSYHEHIVGER